MDMVPSFTISTQPGFLRQHSPYLATVSVIQKCIQSLTGYDIGLFFLNEPFKRETVPSFYLSSKRDMATGANIMHVN